MRRSQSRTLTTRLRGKIIPLWTRVAILKASSSPQSPPTIMGQGAFSLSPRRTQKDPKWAVMDRGIPTLRREHPIQVIKAPFTVQLFQMRLPIRARAPWETTQNPRSRAQVSSRMDRVTWGHQSPKSSRHPQISRQSSLDRQARNSITASQSLPSLPRQATPPKIQTKSTKTLSWCFLIWESIEEPTSLLWLMVMESMESQLVSMSRVFLPKKWNLQSNTLLIKLR